jgi:hypothetical protein
MGDVTLLFNSNTTEGEKFKRIIQTFYNAMGLMVNMEKYDIWN